MYVMCMGVQMCVPCVCRLDLLCIWVSVCVHVAVYRLDVPICTCELGMPLDLCLYVSECVKTACARPGACVRTLYEHV